MADVHLSALTSYPVKSARGIALPTGEVDATGLGHDRSFMVVTRDGTYLTQRELPRLALVHTAFQGDDLVMGLPSGEDLRIGLTRAKGVPIPVRVWDDHTVALDQGDDAADLLTAHLGVACRLVRKDPAAIRPADADYAPGAEVSFVDGFPFLLTTEASLADLNARLPRPLPMERFRPNLVVTGSEPFAEDDWRVIRIGDVVFDVVKPCARCAITTVDQQTGKRDGAEPLRTLGTFRRGRKGVLFGQNLAHRRQGTLRVGDEVVVLERR
jgi:uncharacterized protein YcbX